jgi:hypothetical protein
MNQEHPDSTLDAALRTFEAVEANLGKLERVWSDMKALIPGDLAFDSSDSDSYNERGRELAAILTALPAIDGRRLEDKTLNLSDVLRNRIDAREIGEIDATLSVEEMIYAMGPHIAEYRFLFDRKRRELVRNAVNLVITRLEAALSELLKMAESDPESRTALAGPGLEEARAQVAQLDTLLGSSVPRPKRWADLHRHLHFAQPHDIHDIVELDWPEVKPGILNGLYGDREPLPVTVVDLGDVVAKHPAGPVRTALDWASLDSEGFEALIFDLISQERGYENPQWLMPTNAPDRGRDLSVVRVIADPLAGTLRERVLIQCRHWLSNSVSVRDVAALKEAVRAWEPPRVDILVIATTGRFSADAVQRIEQHNLSDSALRIEMWPDSHLERLVAGRPGLVAQYRLK